MNKDVRKLKEMLRVGEVYITQFPGFTVHGNLRDTVFPGKEVRRKLVANGPKGIMWEDTVVPGGDGSSLYWNSIGRVEFGPDDKWVRLYHPEREQDSTPFLTYYLK
jgi:hypothetical protein